MLEWTTSTDVNKNTIHPFVMMPPIDMYPKEFSSIHFRILNCLTSRCGVNIAKYFSWPSQAVIAKDIGKTRSRVNVAIQELKEWKFIRIITSKDPIKGKVGEHNFYIIDWLLRSEKISRIEYGKYINEVLLHLSRDFSTRKLFLDGREYHHNKPFYQEYESDAHKFYEQNNKSEEYKEKTKEL